MSRKAGIVLLLLVLVASYFLYTIFWKEPSHEAVPGLSVSVKQPSWTTSGSQVRYNITVTNTGNCDLNVNITDSLGFAWQGLLPSGESKILQATFEAAIEGVVENKVEAVGYYRDLKVFSSDTTSTEVEAVYSLIDASKQGKVSTEFLGTGYCSGSSIQLKIKCEVEFGVKIEIEPGWIIVNSGSGQNMIIAEKRVVTVKPEVELKITIEAYCLDIDRDNPSSKETLLLQEDPGDYGTEAVKLMRFVTTAPEERRSISTVQIALWLLLGDISESDIRISFSETDILDAKWLLENIGIDVNRRRIFGEISERPTLPLEITQHSFFEDTLSFNIMGEVQNTGKNGLIGIEVKAVFYDISGSIVWVESGYTMRSTLPPREKSPFHIWFSKDEIADRSINFTRYDIWPEEASDTSYIPYGEFKVSNVSVEREDGLYVTGDVENIGSLTSTAHIVVSVYDEGGKLVGCGSNFNPELEHGQTWSFEIWGPAPPGTIDKWVIYVEGTPSEISG